jgi:hypothetical protein
MPVFDVLEIIDIYLLDKYQRFADFFIQRFDRNNYWLALWLGIVSNVFYILSFIPIHSMVTLMLGFVLTSVLIWSQIPLFKILYRDSKLDNVNMILNHRRMFIPYGLMRTMVILIFTAMNLGMLTKSIYTNDMTNIFDDVCMTLWILLLSSCYFFASCDTKPKPPARSTVGNMVTA